MGPMKTRRLSCPSRQGSISTSMETWMRTASMKVSESLVGGGHVQARSGPGPHHFWPPQSPLWPSCPPESRGVCSPFGWLRFPIFTPSNPVTWSGHHLTFTSTELPGSYCRHGELTDKCLCSLSPSYCTAPSPQQGQGSFQVTSPGYQRSRWPSDSIVNLGRSDLTSCLTTSFVGTCHSVKSGISNSSTQNSYSWSLL